MKYTDKAFIAACGRLRQLSSFSRIQGHLAEKEVDMRFDTDRSSMLIKRGDCLSYG